MEWMEILEKLLPLLPVAKWGGGILGGVAAIVGVVLGSRAVMLTKGTKEKIFDHGLKTGLKLNALGKKKIGRYWEPVETFGQKNIRKLYIGLGIWLEGCDKGLDKDD